MVVAVVLADVPVVDVSIVDVDDDAQPRATQYASPTCTLLHDGAFTAGFHAINVFTSRLYFSAIR